MIRDDVGGERLAERLVARGVEPALSSALRVKHQILSRGLTLTGNARGALNAVRRTRSGVSGGLDLLLDGKIYVNAPVREQFVLGSPIRLTWDAQAELWALEGAAHSVMVDVLHEPAYYGEAIGGASERTADQIGQMCSADRFCYGITGPSCRFWPEADRCRYCSIGLNHSEDGRRKRTSELLDSLRLAISDDVRPARHVLLGGGTPNSADMGASICADLCREIKKQFDVPIYVMIAAPLENESIDELFESGADELGINLEFWSPEAWTAFIPGKAALIGRARFLDAIRYAGEVFGPIRSRSIMITGLEPESSTLDGVRYLVDVGVMPILSPFRPLDGTMLEQTSPPSALAMESVLVSADEIAQRGGLPLGPTCDPCQNNVLAIPSASQGNPSRP